MKKDPFDFSWLRVIVAGELVNVVWLDDGKIEPLKVTKVEQNHLWCGDLKFSRRAGVLVGVSASRRSARIADPC